MAVTMDIVEFLTARLDEREQLARESCAGGDGRWHTGDVERWDNRRIEADDPDQFTIYDEGGHNEDQAAHIAYHDPAHVLAEVKAKRAILAEHKHVPATEPSTSGFGCQVCAYDRGDCVQYGWGWCKTVRLLAAPHDQHPDYDQTWRVE